MRRTLSMVVVFMCVAVACELHGRSRCGAGEQRDGQTIEVNLQEQSTSEDSAVALDAGWKLLNSQKSGFHDLIRYFGIIEGRTRVRVPTEWEIDTSLHLAVDDKSLLREVWNHYRLRSPNLELGKNGLVLNHRATTRNGSLPQSMESSKFTHADDKVSLEYGKTKIPFDEILSRVGARALNTCICSVETNAAMSFVVLPHEAFPVPYSLFAIDSASGRVLWQKDVAAILQVEFRMLGGGAYHDVYLSVASNRIGVFGSSAHGDYFEVFDSKSGQPLIAWRSSSPSRNSAN